MTKYNEIYKSSLDWTNVFVRTSNFPLDRSSIFGSYEDALEYAKGTSNDERGLGGTSYVGQVIAVYENELVRIYKIVGKDIYNENTKTVEIKDRGLEELISREDFEESLNVLTQNLNTLSGDTETFKDYVKNELETNLNTLSGNVETFKNYTQNELTEIKTHITNTDEIVSETLNELETNLNTLSGASENFQDSTQNELTEIKTHIIETEEVIAASLNDLNEKIQINREEIVSSLTAKLIKQSGSTYDCENGFLTLTTNNEENNILIPLTSNYGAFESGTTEFNKNRLQFVHCDKLFNTSEEAKKYVNGNLIVRDRPSLFAEPMILKYGNAENPNILLAIGSVGDGKNPNVENKLFFIDCAEIIKNSIKEYKDSSSISHNIINNEDGIIFESNVNLQPTKTVGSGNYNNIILKEENGLFTHVNVEIIDNKLIININGNIKEYKIIDQILLSTNTDNILVKRNDGLYANVDINYNSDTDTINFNNGIEEKNINLSSFIISSEKTKTIDNNIIRTKSGTTITSNVLLSNETENILKIVDSGLFANVSLNYNRSQNKLIFSTSNGEKELQLSSHSLVTDGRYDPNTKQIILTIITDENQVNEVEIPVGDLVNIFNVSNTNDSPIILTKTTDAINGVDTLTANLKISVAEDNLIKVKSDGTTSNLYASNLAENLYGQWAKVKENGEVIYSKKSIQEIIGILQTYYETNDSSLGMVFNEIDNIKNQLNNLIDFGYTDDEENIENN